MTESQQHETAPSDLAPPPSRPPLYCQLVFILGITLGVLLGIGMMVGTINVLSQAGAGSDADVDDKPVSETAGQSGFPFFSAMDQSQLAAAYVQLIAGWIAAALLITASAVMLKQFRAGVFLGWLTIAYLLMFTIFVSFGATETNAVMVAPQLHVLSILTMVLGAVVALAATAAYALAVYWFSTWLDTIKASQTGWSGSSKKTIPAWLNHGGFDDSEQQQR